MGRPTKYKPEMCQQLIDAMEEGLSKEAASAAIGISKDTLYRWAESKPEFSDAIKQGEQLSRLFWERIGLKGLKGEIPGFNATTWIFNMKNRHGWRDKQDMTTDGEKMTPNEWHIHPVKRGDDDAS